MKKQVYIMLGVIAVLALGIVIVLNVGINRKKISGISSPILGKVKVKNITSIEVNDTITLRLNKGVWSYMVKHGNGDIVPKLTRQDYVQSMLESLSTFSRGKLIDSAPDDLSEYNLEDDDGARTLLLKDDKDALLMKFRVGVVVGALSANYAQIDDNIAIYKIGEGLSFFLNQGSQYWLDVRLFPNGIDAKKVKTIKISKKNRTDIELTKNRKEWVVGGDANKKVNADAVNSYLSDMSQIKAYKDYAPVLKDDYLNGKLEIIYSNGDIKSATLYYFANKYFIVAEGGIQKEILYFQDYSIDKIFPDFEKFKIADEDAVDADTSGNAVDVTTDAETSVEEEKTVE